MMHMDVTIEGSPEEVDAIRQQFLERAGDLRLSLTIGNLPAIAARFGPNFTVGVGPDRATLTFNAARIYEPV